MLKPPPPASPADHAPSFGASFRRTPGQPSQHRHTPSRLIDSRAGRWVFADNLCVFEAAEPSCSSTHSRHTSGEGTPGHHQTGHEVGQAPHSSTHSRRVPGESTRGRNQTGCDLGQGSQSHNDTGCKVREAPHSNNHSRHGPGEGTRGHHQTGCHPPELPPGRAHSGY